MDRVHWIDKKMLEQFILDCQVRLHVLHDFYFAFKSFHFYRPQGFVDNPPTIPCFFPLLQDPESGGISDRPDDAVDVFHTYFGVAGIGPHHTFFLFLFTFYDYAF